MTDVERTLAVLQYDWVYTLTRGGRRLHHPADVVDPVAWDSERRGEAVTSCGRAGLFAMPGIMSRLGMERCARCCDKLGIKRGIGSPLNDEELHAWVTARLATQPTTETVTR